jgi:hypothetical protein
MFNQISSTGGRFLRELSSSFGVSTSISRSLYLIRSFTGSFLINTASSRISIIYETLSQPAYLAQLMNRIPISVRYIASYFTTNIAFVRANYFFRNILSGISINAFGSIGNIYSQFISLSFTLSSSTTRMLSLFKNIYQPVSTNVILSRFLMIYNVFPTSFSLNSMVYRSSGLIKTVTQSISINSFVKLFADYYKSVTGNFILTDSILRLTSLNRALGQMITLNSLGTRFIAITRYATAGFRVTDSFNRFLTLSRIFSQGLPLSDSMLRAQQLTKMLLQGFMISTTAFRPPKINERIVTLSLTISESITRANYMLRLITQHLSISDSFNRLLYLTRIFAQGFNFNSLILGFRQFLCSWFSGLEFACGGAGCYYCSGTCQATTCPVTPTPPSGGGGWVPPVTNVTLIKTVLDTSVHIETPDVSPGDKAYAIVTIMKVEGLKGVVNVNLSYWIKDISGNILGMKQGVVGIDTVRSDIYYLTVPISADAGTYTFEALAQYGNATDYSFDNFQVTTTPVKPAVIIKRVDVPFILVNENTTIKVVLENQENRKIDLNLTLILPYSFIPQNETKHVSLDPLSEDVVEFAFIPQSAGSFSGFIRMQYEDKKVIKDFSIEVYAPEKFFNSLIRNYWWLVDLILIALLALFIYKTKDRFKRKKEFKYVFRRKDLLPQFK